MKVGEDEGSCEGINCNRTVYHFQEGIGERSIGRNRSVLIFRTKTRTDVEIIAPISLAGNLLQKILQKRLGLGRSVHVAEQVSCVRGIVLPIRDGTSTWYFMS